MGVCVLRTPPQAPQANSVCERLGGGFPHPARTAASQGYSQSVGTPLQSRPRSHDPGPGYSGSASSITAPIRASTPASARLSSASQSRAGRTAPRVLVGKGRGVSAHVILAHHNSRNRRCPAVNAPTLSPSRTGTPMRSKEGKRMRQPIASRFGPAPPALKISPGEARLEPTPTCSVLLQAQHRSQRSALRRALVNSSLPRKARRIRPRKDENRIRSARWISDQRSR
jgi:hypothetical protein